MAEHPVNDWFGAFTGAAPKASLPFPNAPDPSNKAVVIADYIPTGCRDCSKRDQHFAAQRFTYSGRWKEIPELERIPLAQLFLRLATFLQWQTHIAIGPPTKGHIYNAGAGNNLLDRIADYTVQSVSGKTVTVEYGAQDPQYLRLADSSIENPNWPGDGGRLIFTPVFGRLQHMDYASFESGPLAGRNYMVEKISRNAGAGTATFTLDQDVSLADAGDVFRLYRMVIAKPRYPEPILNLPMVCGDNSKDYPADQVPIRRVWESADFPENGAFPLLGGDGGNARVCVPRVAGNAEKKGWVYVSVKSGGVWQNKTVQCISERRFYVHQAATPGPSDYSYLMLGAANAHGEAQQDLIDGAEAVLVEYWIETPTTEKGVPVCQRYCRNAVIAGRGGAYAGTDGVKDDSHPKLGYSWVCLKRSENPNRIDTFRPECFQPDCSHFEEAPAMLPRAADFNKIWYASFIRLVQSVAGIASTSNFQYEVLDFPSLGYLAGLFREVAPVSYRPRVSFVGSSVFGRVIDNLLRHGAFWDFDFDWDNADLGAGTGIGEDMLGLFPQEVTGWKDARPDPKDESEVLDDDTDPGFQFRATPPRQIAGYSQDEGRVAGERGQGHEQVMAANVDQVLIPIVNPTATAQQFRHRAIMDNKFYGADLNEVGNIESATYHGKIQLTTDWDMQGDEANAVIVEGVIAGAGSAGGNLIYIDVELGAMQAGTIVGGQRFDRVTAWVQGGNFVDLWTWAKLNNYYSGNVMDGQWQKCHRGLAIHLPDHAIHSTKRFFVSRALPCAGADCPTGNRPVELTENFPFEAARFDGGGNKVSPWVTQFTDSDEYPIEEIYEAATPANVLKRVTMAESPLLGGEAKFEYDPGTDTWFNQAVPADDIAAAAFESTGVPPGARTTSAAFDLRLADGEYWAGLVYHPELDAIRWTLRFSQDQVVLDLTAAWTAGAGGGTEAVTVYQTDFPISEAIYNALNAIPVGEYDSAAGSHIGLYINSDTLTPLIRASSATPGDWWTAGTPDNRNQFYPFEFGGDYFIRFHRDYAGLLGQIHVATDVDDVPTDPDDFWDFWIGFHTGLPKGHKAWSRRYDRVWIVNERGLINPADLPGQRIQAKCNVIISPEHDVTLERDRFNDDGVDWIALESGNFAALAATGAVYLEKVWRAATLTAAGTHCLRVTGRFADRSTLPSMRLLKSIVRAAAKLTRVRCTAGGSGFPVFRVATWFTAFSDFECISSAWVGIDSVMGYTKSSINAVHTAGDEELLLLDSPVQTDPGGTCGGNPFPWEDQAIEDEGILDEDYSPAFNFIVGAFNSFSPVTNLTAVAYGNATAFNVDQVLRLPEGCTIVAAGCEVLIENLSLTKSFMELGGSPDVDILTTADISLLLLGIDKNGEYTTLTGTLGGVVESDVWSPIDITAAIKTMYEARKDFNFAVLPAPASLNIADFVHQGKASMIELRNNFAEWSFEPGTINLESYEFRYLSATSFLFRNIWVEYTLPSGLMERWAWPHHNLPGWPVA